MSEDRRERLFRRSDAHAWVEVWQPRGGWLTHDPTPPEPLVVATAPGAWKRVSSMVGTVTRVWRERVVGYEGAWHRDLLNRAARGADRFVIRMTGESGALERSMAKFARNFREQPWARWFAGGVILLNVVFLWLDRRMRRGLWPARRARVAISRDEAFLTKIAKAMAPKPRPRAGVETPAEYLESIAPSSGSSAVDSLIRRYYSWRFNPEERGVSDRDLLAMARGLRSGRT